MAAAPLLRANGDHREQQVWNDLFIELVHHFHAASPDATKVCYYPVSLWAARPRSGPCNDFGWLIGARASDGHLNPYPAAWK
jgi:hypothetical protein